MLPHAVRAARRCLHGAAPSVRSMEVITTAAPSPASVPDTRASVRQAGELRSARIESLRAIAALGVLIGHVFGAARVWGHSGFQFTYLDRVVYGGGLGVFLFFALSGYLLYRPFAARDLNRGDSVDLRRYALNRAVRILPLYYTTLIVLLLVTQHGGSAEQWWRFGLFLQTYSSHTVGTVDGPMWSLVVEVQFYALLPLIALAVARVSRGSAPLAAVSLAGLGAISYLVRLATLGGANPSDQWRFSFPDCFVFFVPGMLLALLQVSWAGKRPRWLRGGSASSAAWLAVATGAWLLVFWRSSLDVAVLLATFATVGVCVLPLRPARVVAALEWRPLAVLGVASYSLYLWHLPIVGHFSHMHGMPTGFAAQALIEVPLCCAVALASYALVEAPWLRLRRRWARLTPLGGVAEGAPSAVSPRGATAARTPGSRPARGRRGRSTAPRAGRPDRGRH